MESIIVKNAHWPWISFKIGEHKKFIGRKFFSLKKKSGYGIQLKGDFIALIASGSSLFFVFNDEWCEVTGSDWNAKTGRLSGPNKVFKLLKNNDEFLSINFIDRDQGKSITPEPHFLDDVVEWLKNDESKGRFMSLFDRDVDKKASQNQ